MKLDKKNNYKLKVIETEEEYKIQLKKYKKRLGKLFRTAFRHLGNPHIFLNEFDKTLDEMVFIRLITPEFATSERIRLYRELNKPNEFRGWISDSLEKVKKKFKKNDKEIQEQHKKIKKCLKERELKK